MKHTMLLAALLALPLPVLAQTTTLQDRSGTITAGGTAQQLMPLWQGRHGCIVQNLSATDLWINDQGTAAAAAPSIKVPAGAQFVCVGPTGAVLSIFGATTAQPFAAREW